MRPKITFYEIKDILESGFPLSDNIISYLVNRDVLLGVIDNILPNYRESKIMFEPTYKRDCQTGIMKLEKNKKFKRIGRLPGYADRILYKLGNPSLNIKEHIYDSIKLTGNDHFPVLYFCRLHSFTIGIVTWNIGSADKNNICPAKLLKYFEDLGEYTDILVIGFQEASIYSIPCLDIWKNIYNKQIHISGTNFKSYFGHLIGYGLETCIFWDDSVVQIDELKQDSSNERFTKASHCFSFRIKNNRHELVCSFANIHAPFTNNKNKYYDFIKNASQKLDNVGVSDIYFIFGDLNSRSKLPLCSNCLDLYIKNIYLNHKIPPIGYIENKYLSRKVPNEMRKNIGNNKTLLLSPTRPLPKLKNSTNLFSKQFFL